MYNYIKQRDKTSKMHWLHFREKINVRIHLNSKKIISTVVDKISESKQEILLIIADFYKRLGIDVRVNKYSIYHGVT